MKSLNKKKGSAIITAIGMGIVLLIVIASVFSFSKYRTQTVINESKKVKALALAEAGLEVALGELFNNASFQTHEVEKPSGPEENPKWKENPLSRECILQPNKENGHNFQIDSSKSGTISGTLGDGKFKARIGNIPYEDNPNTKAVDESKAYVFIESIGMYDKTVRKIAAVINRRYPCREFLMYDGGILSVVYGQCSDNNTNVFSIGHLYGHMGVEISQVMNRDHGFVGKGTKQKIDHIDAILSGEGGILFYSDVEGIFFDKKGNQSWSGTIKSNISFPTSGKYSEGKEEFGELPDELKKATPDIPPEISNWVKDKNSGIRIPPKAPSFNQYKTEAQKGGHFLTSTKKYKVTQGFGSSVDAVYLDFGSGRSKIRQGNVNANDIRNGIFYSEKDIVIKGNPPKDVSIVSEKNVFVAGDFNQNGTGKDQQKYCYPQDYPSGKNALSADDYIESYKEDFKRDAESNGDDRIHVAATVIAKERLIFDHRSAVDCCENELYPYLKYELAKAISDQPNESEAAKVLNPNDCTSVSIIASDSVDGFKANIATFAKNFNISESNLSELESAYPSGGKFNDSDLDKLTQATWNAFKKDYTGGDEYAGSVNIEDNCAVNVLISKLRKKMCGENPEDLDNNTDKFFEPSGPDKIKDKQGDYLFYPEMTTNGMFVSCGKLNNTFYSGPDVSKYFNEIGYSSSSKSEGVSNKWYNGPDGLLHRTFGTETNLRLYDVPQITTKGSNKNVYVPPTRKKVYDNTLIKLGAYEKNNLELTGFVVLSWQDLAANEEEFEAF